MGRAFFGFGFIAFFPYFRPLCSDERIFEARGSTQILAKFKFAGQRFGHRYSSLCLVSSPDYYLSGQNLRPFLVIFALNSSLLRSFPSFDLHLVGH